MKILLTGSTGYIGRRLLPALLSDGHELICLVRDQKRFDWDDFTPEERQKILVVEGDLSNAESLTSIPLTFDITYYLVHSMSSSYEEFIQIESASAHNFIAFVNQSNAKQIIYLSGIVNDRDLSHHLLSRKNVEDILKTSKVPTTVLRAAIIIGSGSASFEIIRDLAEKLPVMIAPRWLKTRCQPIGIRNVIEYLKGVILQPETYNQSFDIGGTSILTYKDMLLGYSQVRKLKRLIITVPLLTPRLSTLWLYFVTSTSFSLARALVESMKNEVICHDTRIQNIIPIKIYSYPEALQFALDKISQKNVISSWKDAITRNAVHSKIMNYTKVPEHGVLTDQRLMEFQRNKSEVIENLWRIGGEHGWYFGNWMWRIRGLLDKMVGGVGLIRGRRSEHDLKPGDALDLWRVLVADKAIGRLLLYAEMKLPGEAWLEFKIKEINGKYYLHQTATFLPHGLWGRIYWYSLVPFHGLIFPKMAHAIVAMK